MCHRLRPLTLALLLAGVGSTHAAEFTYRGQLSDRGAPANGRYDLSISAYIDEKGLQLATAPLVLEDVTVSDGQFAAALELPEFLGSSEAWIALAVRDGDALGAFEPLPGRSKLETAAVCPNTWLTTGNAGTLAATNFLGTTDNIALQLRSNNRRVLQAANVNGPFPGGGFESANILAGDYQNTIGSGATGVTIAGGGGRSIFGGNTTFVDNEAHGHFNTIGGGASNRTGVSGADPVELQAITVAGGARNVAEAPAATIAGGSQNRAVEPYATVGGGTTNLVSGNTGTIAGGEANLAQGAHSAVAGGLGNSAFGNFSFIGGGESNEASGSHAVALGDSNSANGTASLAAGTGAFVRGVDPGSFAWSDFEAGPVWISTAPNQFLVRARGGVGINTTTKPGGVTPIDSEVTITSNTARVDTNVDIAMYPAGGTHGYSVGVAGSTDANTLFFVSKNNGATFNTRFQIDADGTTRNLFGAWSMLSDARLKRDVQPIASALDRILGLRGVTFEYLPDKAPMASPGRRAGFIAQEVEQVFPEWVSENADGYKQITLVGYEAVIVEALRESHTRNEIADAQLEQRLEQLARAVDALQADNARLEAALAARQVSTEGSR